MSDLHSPTSSGRQARTTIYFERKAWNETNLSRPADLSTGAESGSECANYFPERSNENSPPDLIDAPPEGVQNKADFRPRLHEGETGDDDLVVLGRVGKHTTSPNKRRRRTVDRRRRKQTRAIDPDLYREMNDAWAFARLIGMPLNYMLTIRPANIDDLDPEERNALWIRTRKKIDQWFRDHSIDHACIWSRESDRHTGRGEHYHELLHLPASLVAAFEDAVRSWFPGRNEVDLSPRDQRVRRTVSGKIMTAATYVAKAASPRITYANRSVPYRPSGPVFGKRAGVTRNLGKKAVAGHRSGMDRRAA